MHQAVDPDVKSLGRDVEIIGDAVYHRCDTPTIDGMIIIEPLIDRSNGGKPAFWCPGCGKLIEDEGINMMLKLYGVKM